MLVAATARTVMTTAAKGNLREICPHIPRIWPRDGPECDMPVKAG